MSNTNKRNWIIGMSGSEWDDVCVKRVYGTEYQVKKYLVNLVKNHSAECDDFDYRDDRISKITKRSDGTLYAGITFSDHHNDYTATPEMDVENLS